MGPQSPGDVNPGADGSELNEERREWSSWVTGPSLKPGSVSKSLVCWAVTDSRGLSSHLSEPTSFPGPGSAQLPSWPQDCFVINTSSQWCAAIMRDFSAL